MQHVRKIYYKERLKYDYEGMQHQGKRFPTCTIQSKFYWGYNLKKIGSMFRFKGMSSFVYAAKICLTFSLSHAVVNARKELEKGKYVINLNGLMPLDISCS